MSEQARQNLTQSHQCDKITSQSTSMTSGGSAKSTSSEMSEQARQNLTQSHQCDKITSQSTSMTFGGSAERTETQSIDKVSLKKATSHDYTQIVTLVSNGETSSARIETQSIDKVSLKKATSHDYTQIVTLVSNGETSSGEKANDEKPGESINKRLQKQPEGCLVKSVFDKNMETLRKPDTATLFVTFSNSTHDDEFPWSFDAVSELMNIRPWSSSFLAYMLSKARKAIAKGKITISTSKCHVCFTIMDDCYETHKFEEYHQIILCRWSMQSYSKHASLESPYLKNL